MVALSSSARSTAGRPAGIADGAQRGDGGLPAPHIVVPRDGGRAGRRRRHPAFGQEPGGTHRDQGIGVAQRLDQERHERGARSRAPDRECALDRRPRSRSRAGPTRIDVGHGEGPGAGQGADGGGLHPGVTVGQTPMGPVDLAGVPGHDDLASPPGRGAAVGGPVPWQDPRSSSRVWPTLTHHRRRGHRLAPPRAAAPGRASGHGSGGRWSLVWSWCWPWSLVGPRVLDGQLLRHHARVTPHRWRRSSPSRPTSTTR